MRVLRARTGCFACRRRKKKCDERKPVCTGCQRNRLSCQWRTKSQLASCKTAASRSVTSVSAPIESSLLSADGDPEYVQMSLLLASPSHISDFPIAEPTDKSPNSAAANTGQNDEQDLFHASLGLNFASASTRSEECCSESSKDSLGTNVPLAGTTGTTDFELPFDISGHDSVDNVDVEQIPSGHHQDGIFCDVENLPPVSMDIGPLLNTSMYFVQARSYPLSFTPSPFPDLESDSFELLSHYMASTSRSMDNSSAPDNPFSVQLIPLAFGSKLVLHLILTQSAVHRAIRLQNDGDTVASKHYYKSVQLFQHNITNYNNGMTNEGLLLAAGALIMCFIETAKGDINGTIFSHLNASHSLLSRLLTNKPEAPKQLLDFLVEYYIYAASLSMISLDVHTDSPFPIGKEVEDYARGLVFGNYVGGLCGCWLELLLHIPRIFKLGNRFLTQGYTCQPVSADDFTQYADIQSRVQAWTPASSVRAEVALTGRIFQSAILLYLYTTLNPLATGEDRSHATTMEVAIDDAFASLAQLPSSARINTSLCWPIAVLGSCVTDQTRRNLLRSRLNTMFTTIGLGNIRQTSILLEKMWEKTGTDPWSIGRVMQESQILISLA